MTPTTPDSQPTSTVTALEVLKELEWSKLIWSGGAGLFAACPVCEQDRESGHTSDCRLSQALATDTTAERVVELEAALQDCISTLALCERPSTIDPQNEAQVNKLGRKIGFGAMMHTASASWAEYLRQNGHPNGGQFVVGPCLGTLKACLHRARAALHADKAASAEGVS